MPDVQEEIAAFYAGYLEAWNKRDMTGLADCFTLPATFVSPMATVCVTDRAELRTSLTRNFERLESQGFSHSVLGSLTVRASNEGLAVADARGVRRLCRDGSLLEEIDAHYILRHDARGWRFAVTVSCAPGWQEA